MALPPLQPRARRALLILLAWTAVGAVAALQPLVGAKLAGRPLQPWDFYLSIFQSCWTWALFFFNVSASPAIYTQEPPIFSFDLADQAPTVVFGVFLIVIMLLLPGGVVSGIRRLAAFIVGTLAGRPSRQRA